VPIRRLIELWRLFQREVHQDDTARHHQAPDEGIEHSRETIAALKSSIDDALSAFKTHHEQQKAESRKNRTIAKWAVFGAFAAFVAAGAQAWIGMGALEQARDANRIAVAAQQQTRHFIVEAERPWLGVTRIPTVELKRRIDIEVVFGNSGKTPAIDVEAIGKVGLLKEEVDSAPQFPGPIPRPVGPSVVFPGGVFNLKFRTSLSPKEFQAVRSGALLLVVGGRVAYKDGVGREHYSDFCGIYQPVYKTFTWCRGGNVAN
jgi:hypothetical protein